MGNDNSSFKKLICCLYQSNYSLLLSITILAYLILSSCNIQKREEPQKISNSKVIKDELKNLKIEKESAPTELTFKVPPMPAAPEAFIFKVPPMPIIPESISSSNKSITYLKFKIKMYNIFIFSLVGSGYIGNHFFQFILKFENKR